MADFRLGRLKFNWRGAWAASTAYVIDDIVSFKGNTYVCVVNHTSASSEGAWATTDLNIGSPRWQLHVPGIRIMGAWTANTFYAVNDLVSYGANQYLCTTDHTSAANENLFYSSDISNWSLYTSSTSYRGDWSTGTWYKLNDIVKYGNTLYVTTVAHTSGIQFDVTKYSVYLESINFEDTWAAGVEYQPGDIVTFGGYTYIAETINTGKQPNIFNVDITDPNTLLVTPRDWNVVTTGFDTKGEYDPSTVYVPGDVVQYGGNTFVKITTSASGVAPTSTSDWDLVASGLNWRGPWSAGATYQINDVVSSTSASWVNLTANNTNLDPVADQTNTGGANWQALAQGESTLTLSNPGDILYRNSSGANVNLPIGADGEVLTVDAAGLPSWLRNNWCANVYYVATDGTDDPAYGKNISKPWASIAYALSQLPAGSATAINTIFVKSGTYEETLPLIVPAYTSIVGDNLRATIVKPDPNTTSAAATPRTPAGSENRFSTMWVLSESTTLKDMIFEGMEGFVPAGGADEHDINQATVRGVFLELNANTPILGKSPYITQCSAFSGRPSGTAANCTGGVGAIIDKIGIYGNTTSNGSMLFDSFTQFHDLGVGFWCKDLGNAEIVSSFTYYCHIGYTCTGGGRIRSLVGNNSWGTYGAVSIGYDNTETEVTGKVRGQRLNFLYDENSSLFLQNEEVVQGADDGVVDQSWSVTGGTTVGAEADAVYTSVASSSANGSGATFDVTRNSLGSITSVAVNIRGSGYSINDVVTVAAADINDTSDLTITLSDVADDFEDNNVNYARALILYVQTEYLIIEPITGTFTTDKPITGDGSATVVASQALGRTAAGGATPALEGIKGKIFPLTNLPVDGSNNPIFPKPTGAVQFLDVIGNSSYDDDGSYVIKEVVDPSSASDTFVSTYRQYDVPGAPPSTIAIDSISRSNNVATVTFASGHGLSTGDKVVVTIPSVNIDVKPFTTGYDSSDGLTLGIRNNVLQRTTITEGANGQQFTYPNTGPDITIASGDSKLNDAVVIKQTTTGGSTKGAGGVGNIHLGGTSVTLYNVSNQSARLNPSGTGGLGSSTSDTEVIFDDNYLGLLAVNGGSISSGAGNFLMINNEIMAITGFNGTNSGCTVTRAQEGTTIAAHPDGSMIYYLTKTENATTIRSDVDTAVNDVPLFSISNFDDNDIIKINDEFFKVYDVLNNTVGRATIIFAQPKNINANSGQNVEIRLRYSQVRMTGHDFLQVGTGSKSQTNWPDQPLQDADQSKETKEDLPGRVYYVSSDQDGNFRVGEFFTVEQATGTATLDASAFNLAGLASLRLGTLGAELGVAINEFSSDKTLGGDFARDSAVPTQLAVKTYVDGSVGAGVNRSKPIVGVQQLTSSGTTATVKSFVANNVYQGDTVEVSGADQANYNGTFVVQSVDLANNSFTYILPGTAVSPATGAIQVERKQRVSSDLTIEGLLDVTPTWDTAGSTEGLKINATNTQSGAGTNLIRAQVTASGTTEDKLILDKDGNLTISGNLTVDGTTTTINSSTLSIDDKQIVIGDGLTNSAQDLTAATGSGLVLGATGRDFTYNHANTRWELTNAGLNLGSSSGLSIAGTSVLTSTTLGTGVTGSSLTSVGTLTGLTVDGVTKIQAVDEAVSVVTGTSSGTQSYDFADYAIVYHASVNGTITAAWTNVPTDAGARVVTVAINNGGTAYGIDNSFGINGTSYTVKWASATAPALKANQVNVFSFTLINDGSTFQVLGNMTAFG